MIILFTIYYVFPSQYILFTIYDVFPSQYILFTIYDVFHSQYKMYFIQNIFYSQYMMYFLHNIFHSQYMMHFLHNMIYFIHNIWFISFTIYLFTIYFIHNILYISFTIWYILFTIYDVFHSQYILFTIYDIFHSQYIMYFIHNIVNKIRHTCCSAFVVIYIFWTTHSISFCSNLFNCAPAVSLYMKTDRHTWKPHRAVFQIFLSNSPWDEAADFLTRASVACGFRIHFVHDSTAADCPKLDRQTLARLILFLHPHYMLQSNLHSYY